ncbi:hypothetical protein PlfCFBP13513_15315 [Plantibacter flavus]|nr:hypothetical protein PlfCFBP13513_15315 [Plantibacter flavus]
MDLLLDGYAPWPPEVSATAAGALSAFLVGGLLSIAAIVASFFARRPTSPLPPESPSIEILSPADPCPPRQASASSMPS